MIIVKSVEIMKKYFLYTIFLFALAACNDDEKSIVDDGGDVRDYGDVEAKFEAKKFDGTVTRQVTMGELVSFFDISNGRPDKRSWNLPGAEPQSSDRLMTTVIYPIPGIFDVSLSVERTSDGQTDELTETNYIEVLSIPVEAAFTPSFIEENGVLNIKTGDKITFTDNTTGLPEIWAWEFPGGTPATSSEMSPTIQYLEPGVFDLKFKATRDDAGNLVESEIVKTAYINVVQRVVKFVRAVATDNKVVLTYTEPMLQDIPADALSEFDIVINTEGGGTLNPSFTAIKALDDYHVELTFNDKMYSNDEVLVSFTPTGKFTDATGLYNPPALDAEPCVYGHNLWDATDMEDESKFMRGTNTLDSDGIFEFVNEDSPEYAIKPYQGHKCIVLVRGTDKVAASVVQGFNVAEGDVVEFAYEARNVATFNGALERRMSLIAGDGQNTAGGNWMRADDNGKGLDEWITVKKTINVSADTKGYAGELFFHFLRYGGDETQPIWIDNLRIYVPNPR